MEQYHTGDKIIDEGKQGEALVIDKVKSGDRKLYIESYGCQMNFADSEVVASILKKEGYHLTDDSKKANLVLLNTCSIRDKAEQTVRKKLKTFNSQKKENWNWSSIGNWCGEFPFSIFNYRRR